MGLIFTCIHHALPQQQYYHHRHDLSRCVCEFHIKYHLFLLFRIINTILSGLYDEENFVICMQSMQQRKQKIQRQ